MLPSGVFFRSYQAEAALLRTWPQRLWAAGFMILLIVLPMILDNALLGIVTTAGITLVAVLGLQITIGLAGQLNLGQSAFVGVGTFVTAFLASKGYSIWLCMPAAALSAGTTSIAFGLPAVRIKGIYLTLTTIAAQIMFPMIIIRLPDSLFGGNAGLPVDPAIVFGVVLNTPQKIYWFVLAVVAIAFLAAVNLGRSRVGRAFRAMRDNDIASSVLGVNLARYKISAFFAGAFFAGVSGSLYAYYVRYASVEQFTLWLSIWYVGMLIVGGMRTPLGAVLGVAVITTLQETVHMLGTLFLEKIGGVSGGAVFAFGNMVLGSIIVIILLFYPMGLAHRWSLLVASYRGWPYPRT